MSTWTWIRHEGAHLRDLGVLPDGSLHNPNGYPEDTVRAAVAAAEQRSKARRSASARKAAVTRNRRQEAKVYEAAHRIASGETCGPRNTCVICGRGLDDVRSVRRGIGSECWQHVLDTIEGRISPKDRFQEMKEALEEAWR